MKARTHTNIMQKPLVIFASIAVAVFALTDVAGAMQEYEDLKKIIAEIETDISKANSGVIEDDNQYFLIECYLGEDGTLWLCWWDWDNWCFSWDCLEYSGPSDATKHTSSFLDSHVGSEKEPYVGINNDNIYTFCDGCDIRRGALPFVGAEPQNRTDN